MAGKGNEVGTFMLHMLQLHSMNVPIMSPFRLIPELPPLLLLRLLIGGFSERVVFFNDAL